jgi:hypothetical protein
VLSEKAFDGQIQGVGAVEGEDEVVGVLAIEEAIEALAALGEEVAGFEGLGVCASSRAGANLGGVLGHRFMDGGRLWEAGGGVVEVEGSRGGRHGVAQYQ